MKTKSTLSLALAGALWATSALAGPTPPTVACPRPLLVEATSPRGTLTNLAARIMDPDGDALTAVWYVNDAPVLTNDVPAVAAGETNTAALTLFWRFPLGTNRVRLIVTDGDTAPVGCRTTVTVQDTTAPVITRIIAKPGLLWPPNHRMVLVTFTVERTDNAEPAPAIRILGITSNEPVNGRGDGNTSPDWIIAGRRTAYLRAERAGPGNGRIYTVTFECVDAAGNLSRKAVRVRVPHDMGH
jgi:hypothetical protein